MKVRELYQDALTYEESPLAHYLLHMIQENLVSMDDDISAIDFDKADHQKVAEMIERNVLGIKKIRIFSLKMHLEKFCFIFAESEEEAIECYKNHFKKAPMNCIEQPLDFEIVRGNETITFRELRKEHEKFPAIVGFYERRH